MKKHNSIYRLIAIILLLAMLVSTAVSCGVVITPDLGSTSTTTTATTTTTKPDNGDDPDPNLHVCVFSDWEIVKEATNTEDGLRERRCECGEVEQEVIVASGKEYVIHYKNLKSAAYPTQTGYNSNEGLLELPVPEADGYTFVGWYTAPVGGDIVGHIPSGSKEDYVLYAHWDAIKYDITYKNVPNNPDSNKTSYTIEDKLKLTTPKWSGLVFSHWSDEKGNVYKPDGNITTLPEKMFGDLVLTANWKVLRNIATPTNDTETLINAYSPEDGMILFIFDLGTIEHVVLDNIHPDMYYKYEGMPINLKLSKTVTVGEETAESVAKTVSKSVSSTQSFSSADTWANEVSASIKSETSIGAKFGVDEIASLSVEKKFGWELSASGSFGNTTTSSSSSGNSSGTSNTVSSSLTYKKEMTSEITENITIDASLPSGYYAYVHAGNVRVFGVVTYEIETGNYYLDTYSRLDNMHSMIMYYADVNQLNNPSVEGLDFNIPKEKILNFVENSYYVEYDANGGEGTMPTTLHSVGGNEKLAENAFTKEGCIFGGWELTTDSGVKIFTDGQSVTDIGKANETVTLKAHWAEDPSYDKDVEYTADTKTGYVSKGVSGESPNITYKVVIEYRNRTANSVEVRVKCTSTITKGWYTVYGEKFNFSVGSNKSNTVELVSFNTWKNISSSDRSQTKTTEWVTVPLSTSAATTISLKFDLWQINSQGTNMTSNYGYSGVAKTWTINIPADK